MSHLRWSFRVAAGLALTAVLPAQAVQYGTLPRRTIPADSRATFRIASADIDGDGALDFAFANSQPATSGPRQNSLYRNDGDGNLTDVTTGQLPADNADSYGVAFGDVDGDGDADLVFGNNGPDFLYLNDGRGKFSDASGQLPSQGATWSVALGDVDRDGDLDLLTAAGGVQNRLYLNDGKGRFTDMTATHMPSAARVDWHVQLVDVDRDLDLDAVFSTQGRNGGVSLYLNDGNGRFTDVSRQQLPPLVTDVRGRVGVGDFDGDNDPDLYVPAFGRPDLLYFNDGKGRFTDATSGRLPSASWGTYDVAVADVDIDGDLDVLTANWSSTGQQNRFYVNAGTGRFFDLTSLRLPAVADPTAALELADLDQDGDLDLLVANWQKQDSVLFNLHRQVYAAKAPTIGVAWALDLHGQPGYATLPQSTIPFMGVLDLSPRPSIPPLGRLGISPIGLFFLPGSTIALPGGQVTLQVPIPNLPGVRGIRVFAQALMLQLPVGPRFSNVQADRIQ